MKYNKLVRDNIPAIIKNKGMTVSSHIADNQEYKDKLYEKLQEEVNEFLTNEDLEELADILEVVYAIGKLQNLGKEELEKIRITKADKRGAFTKRIILEETDD